MKMYGLQFEVLSEPIVMGVDLVFVEVTEMKSGARDASAFLY